MTNDIIRLWPDRLRDRGHIPAGDEATGGPEERESHALTCLRRAAVAAVLFGCRAVVRVAGLFGRRPVQSFQAAARALGQLFIDAEVTEYRRVPRVVLLRSDGDHPADAIACGQDCLAA